MALVLQTVNKGRLKRLYLQLCTPYFIHQSNQLLFMYCVFQFMQLIQ